MHNNEYTDKIPRILVICDSSVQRLAFAHAIVSIGFHLVDCIPSSKTGLLGDKEIDLCLIDCEDDTAVIELLNDKVRCLIGFVPAPKITQIRPFRRWECKLKRKLEQVLGVAGSSVQEDKIYKPVVLRKNWKTLLVLGASMGGPAAVKDFLDNLSSDLPIAIVIAQHIDSIAINRLPNILTTSNEWVCNVVQEKTQLKSGHVCLLTPENAVAFDHMGWIRPLNQSWKGTYKPSISEVMLLAANTFSTKVIHIVFSGMGDDGSDSASTAIALKSKIWVQSLASSQCDSQPKSMLETGHVSFVGTPSELAKKVVNSINLL